MNTVDLKRTVAAIYETELHCYLMRNTIARINHEMAKLGVRRSISEPVYSAPAIAAAEKEDLAGAAEKISLGVGGAIGVVFSAYRTSLQDIVYFPLIETALKALFWVPVFLLGAAAIGAIAGFFADIVAETRAEEETERRREEAVRRAKEDYDRRLADYKQKLLDEDNRCKSELQIKARLSNDVQSLGKKLSESERVLKGLYDCLHMLPQYRNLVAVGYMNDLLSIGAATQLSGSNQLYEKVRANLREDKLLETINGVGINLSTKLDAVITNQNRIYGSLHQIRNEQEELCSTIEQQARGIRSAQEASQRAIEDLKTKRTDVSTAVLEYEARRIRRELEFQGYMKRIGRY